MGWRRALALVVGAWALVAGSGCPTSEAGPSMGSCNELYGPPPPDDPVIAGYELCEETDSSCVFYRSDTPDISCAAICAFRAASCIKAYVNEGGACDPGDAQNPCPRGDGFAQFCSMFDGNTCVNVCLDAAVRGGCETDMDCASPLTCDNDQPVGDSTCQCGLACPDVGASEGSVQTGGTCSQTVDCAQDLICDNEMKGISSCTCVADTGGTDGERNVCDLGAEIPCDQPESDAVCECGRPSDDGTGGTGGGCPNNGNVVRFEFTPSDGSDPFPVNTCAWFDCQGPTNGCALQVFDIEGEDRFFQFLTTTQPFMVDNNVCFSFDFVVDEPGASGPGQGRGLSNQLSFLTGRQFGVWDSDNPTPFASGDYGYRDDGGAALGTFEFFEDGFMGFEIPTRTCPL